MKLPGKVNIGFKKNITNGIVYYTVPAFEPYVDYVFCGDIENSLNFKATRGVSEEEKKQSFKQLCGVVDFSYERCIMTNIVHGVEIILVDESDAGKGVSLDETLPHCDALITDKAGVPIASTHADCMPIALYDKVNNVGCVIHAGWRGILADIQGKAIKLMQNNYGADLNDLLVAIGPTINLCCFEVGKDVGDGFINAFGKKYVFKSGVDGENKKIRVDLLNIVLNECVEFGVLPGNITADGRCTACKGSNLASYRRDGGNAGTMVQIMCLR